MTVITPVLIISEAANCLNFGHKEKRKKEKERVRGPVRAIEKKSSDVADLEMQERRQWLLGRYFRSASFSCGSTSAGMLQKAHKEGQTSDTNRRLQLIRKLSSRLRLPSQES